MNYHTTVHSEAIGAVRLHIVIDPEPCNPRTDFDNAATMACWHRRYRLGDVDGPARLREAVRASRRRRSRRNNDLDDPANLAQALAGCRDIVWLPLFLYDHSDEHISRLPIQRPMGCGPGRVRVHDSGSDLRNAGIARRKASDDSAARGRRGADA
jgi:hypothetical protein